MVPMVRRPCIWCLALLAAATLSAGEDPHGRLELLLEDGLPFSVRDKRADLTVQLTFRDGRPDPEGWAYTRQLAGVEHPLEVRSCESVGNRLRLRLHGEVRDQFPYYEGGRVAITLDLHRYGRQVVGRYTVTTEVLDAEARDRLWKDRVHMAYKDHIVRGRVRPGTVRSLSLRLKNPGWNPPPLRRARGRILPLPVGGRPLADLSGGRPRLLAPTSGDLAGRTTSAPFASWYAGLEERLAAGDGPAGARAAGHACRFLVRGSASDADAALRACDAALADLQREAERWFPYARTLIGVATAYDACARAWPEEARRRIGARLAAEAWHLSGLEAISRESAFYDKGLIGSPTGGHDPRLGILRVAGALAALAAADAAADPPWQERACRAYGACARSVRRFLRTGFGERGAPLGHSLHEEALELVPLLVHAARRNLGAELAERSGIRHALRWGLTAGAWQFDAGSDALAGPWLPICQAVAAPADLPRAAARLQETAPRFPDALAAAWALAVAPAPPAADAPARDWPLAAHDRRTGSLVLRSGWDQQRDFVAVFECGSGAPQAAGAMGRFSLYGRGREWIRRDHAPRGTYRWPRVFQQNALQIHRNRIAELDAMQPAAGGRLQRLRVTPAGSGSLGYRSGPYRLADGSDGGGKEEAGYTWSTLGADYSGASGADCLLVLVGGHYGFRDREVLWPLAIGAVPESRVRITGNTFTVRPDDSGPYLAGTFVYPGRVRFAYSRPEPTAGAVLEVRFRTPQEGNHEKFLAGMTDKILDLDTWSGPTAGGTGPARDTTIDGIDAGDLLVDPDEAATRAEDLEAALAVKAKIFRVTTSNKMGGPDVVPRVVNHAVLVLSVQDGQAPEVVPAALDEDHMLRVGGQTVYYWEYLVEFEQGMRDVRRGGGGSGP